MTRPLPRWHLGELARWAEWGAREERFPDILRPQGLVWPSSVEALERALDAVAAHYGAWPASQALAAAALLGGDATPPHARAWCVAHIDLGDCGMGFDWETAGRLSWTAAPLALALGDRSRLTWCLVGAALHTMTIRPFPRWWDRVADREAREAAENALTVLRARASVQAVAWPMVADTDGIRLTGASLGLPLYLAAWGASRKLPPPGLLATGRLDAMGRIHPVAHRDHKVELAAGAGFHGFLCPASATRLRTAPEPGIEVLEVADLEQAEFLWEACSPGCGRTLLEQLGRIDDPVWLAANVHRIHREVARRPALADRIARSLEAVWEQPDLTRQWIRGLELLVSRPDGCQEALEALLEPVTVPRARDLAHRAPLHAFRLAQVQVAFANHRGRPRRSRRWIALSQELAPALRVHETADQLEEVAANRRFISERHNRYDFRPDLPPDIDRILAELTERHDARRRREPRSVSAALGRLLGTLTQNHGFCGPGHLVATRETAERARKAFGGGHVPEHRDDWRRQFGYEVYALLDAGLHDEAERALGSCLGAPPLGLPLERLERMNPYEHAVLARFLSDTGSAAAREPWLRWADRCCVKPLSGHPWQLWLLNAGLLAPDPAVRERMWMRSVDCCLEMGETAQAMALLPLSELWAAGLGDEDWTGKAAVRVLGMLKGPALSREHFRSILDEPDWRMALERVREGRGRLFPFSYR
ncbi:MAG: hypothetical protein MUF52_15945 [Syntrophobacteraceae bacterium]|nr:hypothetical protein [Syntrophobacteraceae bacterium]